MHDWLAKIDTKALIAQAIHIGLVLLGAVLLLIVGAWACARIANFFRRSLQRSNVDVTLVEFLRNLLYGVLIVLLLVATLQFVGVPSASLVAAVGAAGLAVGLAMQGSLSNLAWGVLLIIFRPFRAGDLVELGSMLGKVESVSLMHTTLVLLDNRQAVLPNAKVGSDVIINFNARGTRRAEIKVGISYDDDIGKAMEVIKQAWDADERVLKDPEPAAFVVGLGDSSVDISVRVWGQTSDVWGLQTSLTRDIKERFDAAGITIPFPQREVSMRRIEGDDAQG